MNQKNLLLQETLNLLTAIRADDWADEQIEALQFRIWRNMNPYTRKKNPYRADREG